MFTSTISTAVDTMLDRTVVLGYGSTGLLLRRRLPTWPDDPSRMDGRVALVTGAASGVGLAAATGLADIGATVHVLGRSTERADDAATTVRERTDGDVRPAVCDVSDESAVRNFCDRFVEETPKLDILVNNAGVMPDERRHTGSGVELSFATHVLAPWMLIAGLRPALERAAPSRVINVTSGGQYGQRVPPRDPQSLDDRYSPKKIYARTKREQLVITEMWARQLDGSGVHVHAMHPGWADTKGVRTWMPIFRGLTRFVIRTPEQGADTIVWLATAPAAAKTTGLFWHDRQPRPATYALGAGRDDTNIREELWAHVTELAARPVTS